MLIGAVARPESAYPDAQHSLLRPALQFNKLSRGPKRPFTGLYTVAIDTSWKVRIPSRLQRQFSGSKVMLQFVNEGLIRIFEPEQWSRAVKRQAPSDPAQLIGYNHRMYAFAYLADIDAHNRVRIPDGLKMHTNFKQGSDAIIIGAGDRVEIRPARILSIATVDARTGI